MFDYAHNIKLEARYEIADIIYDCSFLSMIFYRGQGHHIINGKIVVYFLEILWTPFTSEQRGLIQSKRPTRALQDFSDRSLLIPPFLGHRSGLDSGVTH